MKRGFDRVQEAGAFLAGGHSVQDYEPKYGLVVYGEVEKAKLWSMFRRRTEETGRIHII